MMAHGTCGEFKLEPSCNTWKGLPMATCRAQHRDRLSTVRPRGSAAWLSNNLLQQNFAFGIIFLAGVAFSKLNTKNTPT